MRRRLGWVVGVLLAASLGGLWLASREGPRGPSTYSSASSGWLGAYRYLAAVGADVDRWERPLEASATPGTLVVAFPWSVAALEPVNEAVDGHLARGGTLLVAHSTGLRPSVTEAAFLDGLGVGVRALEKDLPPLAPVRWWRWARSDRRLAAGGETTGHELFVSRSRWRPVPPGHAVVWLTDPGGDPAVSVWSRDEGRVVLFPAELLSNRRLHVPSHRGFLASLQELAADPWTFDEYHHGWTAPDVVARGGTESRAAWDRLLLQLALLYLATAWALARRMGPPWQTPRERAGGSGEFLRRLGRLHREMGHAAEAAARLLERAPALDPRIRPSDHERRRARDAGEQDLLALARSLGRGDEA